MTIRREREKKNKIIDMRLINLIEDIDRPIRITNPTTQKIACFPTQKKLPLPFSTANSVEEAMHISSPRNIRIKIRRRAEKQNDASIHEEYKQYAKLVKFLYFGQFEYF